MTDKTRPQWVDGQPANLSAAALDALMWLQLFAAVLDSAYHLPTNHETNRALLSSAIMNLTRQVEAA